MEKEKSFIVQVNGGGLVEYLTHEIDPSELAKSLRSLHSVTSGILLHFLAFAYDEEDFTEIPRFNALKILSNLSELDCLIKALDGCQSVKILNDYNK